MRRTALRLLTALGVAAATLFAIPGGTASAETTRNPIVFVHGWHGNAAGWDTMKGYFLADGYAADELFAWQYNSSQDNRKTAEQLAAYVASVRQQTGATQVDIVSHSMGGLSSRWYVKFLGGGSYVDDWVSLSGPNHGTDWAYGCFWEQSCYNMQPNSRFLKELNAGDETPYAVNYGTWRSPCDEVIMPSVSTELAGATNSVTSCMAHVDTSTNADVYADVRDFVA